MSSDAERQRRRRARQRRGECVIPVTLDVDAVEGLRALGYLSPWSEGTRDELAVAVNACLRHVLVAPDVVVDKSQSKPVTRDAKLLRNPIEIAT